MFATRFLIFAILPMCFLAVYFLKFFIERMKKKGYSRFLKKDLVFLLFLLPSFVALFPLWSGKHNTMSPEEFECYDFLRKAHYSATMGRWDLGHKLNYFGIKTEFTGLITGDSGKLLEFYNAISSFCPRAKRPIFVSDLNFWGFLKPESMADLRNLRNKLRCEVVYENDFCTVFELKFKNHGKE
jgi:hypothetical protein